MITVVTVAAGDIRPVWELARKTWEPYCHRHGYELITEPELLDPAMAPSWNKIHTTRKALENSDTVWCVDADMTVAVPSAGLEVYCSIRRDLMISQDWNGFCCCMFRAQRSPWLTKFLDFLPLLGDIKDPNIYGQGLGCKWEQNAIKLLYDNFPALATHIGRLPLNLVSDQPEKVKAPFFHFGGRPNAERIRLIKKLHQL